MKKLLALLVLFPFFANAQGLSSGGSGLSNVPGVINGPSSASSFVANGTGANVLPVGTTGQRPTAQQGMIRYNSTTPAVEFPAFVSGNIWATIGANATTTNGSGTFSTYPWAERSSTFLGTFAGYQANETTICSGDNTGIGHRSLQALNSSQQCFYANNDFSQAGNCTQNVSVGSTNMSALACGSATANTFSGSGNVGVGFSVLTGLDPASGAINADRNIVIGESAGNNLKTARQNVLICNDCFSNGAVTNAAIGNTIVGAQTAFASNGASYNTIVGYSTFNASTTGANNTSLGAFTLNANTTGQNNTAMGGLTGSTVTTGSNNTLVGFGVASTTLATGSGNILIGASNAIDANTSSTSNTLKIGNSATPVLSATGINGTPATTVGGTISMPNMANVNTAVTGAVCWNTGGAVTYNTATTCLLSSRRYKDKINPLDGALAEVMRLRPVTYVYKNDTNRLGTQVGLIAEDVHFADKRLVAYDQMGLPKAVRYENLTAVLAAAIQEQQKEIKYIIFGVVLFNVLVLIFGFLKWRKK